MIKKQVVIVGGGPAGLAAAVELHKNGVKDIVILERERHLGGILRQCIHDGFGLIRFKETLSGPEYAHRFVEEVKSLGIEYITDTTVISIDNDKTVTAVSKDGMNTYKAEAVVLAMGCRERTRGAIAIPGERPAGVMTAGVAQSYINLNNTMVGKDVVILGSGDIGLIMARRFTLEGARVKGVYEIQPYPSGLNRNVEQCLRDYDIPLHLSHTVIDIHGTSRLEAITVAEVDESFNAIPGSEKRIECDSLILSVGLIPENELSKGAGVELDKRTKGAIVDNSFETSVDGIFAAGNVLHVHDLVDFVSLEAEELARGVQKYLRENKEPRIEISIKSCDDIIYTIPQVIKYERDTALSFRVKKPMRDCEIQVIQNGRLILSQKHSRIIPAEMMKLNINKDLIEARGDMEVNII